MLKLIFVISLAFHVSYGGISGAGDTQQRLVMPDVKEYRQSRTDSDKHKFGYELEENNHFHHTTTEEDGVRLGCYGHVLEGKKYSTQYVADAKGYRTVNTADLITVYPKSGGERKASFIGGFNEEELMSRNIRFFFPDGCQKIYQQRKNDQQISESRQNTIYAPPPNSGNRRTATSTTTQAPFVSDNNDSCAQRVPECTCTCSYGEQ